MNMQSTKPTRKAKNQAVSYALITFSYLYAGTVLRKPFYAGGVPLLGLLTSGGALLVFSYVCAACFAGRAGRGTRAPSGFFAVVCGMLCTVFCAAILARFLGSLAYFDADYGKPFVVICAFLACLGITLYAAAHTRLCVGGFALLTAIPFLLWTCLGFFAFFTTKKAFALTSPLGGFSFRTGLVPLLAETAYICLDTVFLAVVLCDGQNEETRNLTPRAFLRGTALFLLAVGANLVKNLLLFGQRLAGAAAYPDLAAVRLVPILDLPELSVMINTFACTVKLSVYAACAVTLLKNAFGARYNAAAANGCFAALLSAFCGFFYALRQKAAAKSDWVAFGAFCLAALICFVLYPVSLRKNGKT